MPQPLTDRWHDRDLPVLIEIARLIEASELPMQSAVSEALPDLAEEDIKRSYAALKPTYIDDIPPGSVTLRFGGWAGYKLTERGRRAVGLWPREDDAADALIDLLQQAADNTTNEDDAGNLRKAGRLLKSVPGTVIADVTAALIRQQVGL